MTARSADAGEIVDLEAAWALPAQAPPSRVRRSWLGLCGLDPELCGPGDRWHYGSQCLLIVGAAGMAATSMVVALRMTLGGGAWPVIFGVAFGALVGVNDLTLTMPDGAVRSWWSAAPRLAFAIVFGLVAAMPLTAAIFATDIDRVGTAAAAAAEARSAAEFEGRRPAVVAAAQEVHGPAVAAATAAQDTAARRLEHAATAASSQTAACNSEVTGSGGSGLVGEGPRANVVCARITSLVTAEADARTAAVAAEAVLRDEVARQQSAVDADLERTRPRPVSYDPAALGVVGRIGATHDLLGWWSWPIAGALILLDLLPVLRHLTAGGRPYEARLARLAIGDDDAPPPGLPPAPEATEGTDAADEPTPPTDLHGWLSARLAADPTVTARELWREATDLALFHQSEPTMRRLVRELRRHPTLAPQ